MRVYGSCSLFVLDSLYRKFVTVRSQNSKSHNAPIEYVPVRTPTLNERYDSIIPAALVAAREKLLADKRKYILSFICSFNHRSNGQFR